MNKYYQILSSQSIGTRTNGEETDVWVRVTACRRKINGKGLITHEHVSVPFYMDGSYRAAVDLKP
jgi:ketosteroid isomerase-like protein